MTLRTWPTYLTSLIFFNRFVSSRLFPCRPFGMPNSINIYIYIYSKGYICKLVKIYIYIYFIALNSRVYLKTLSFSYFFQKEAKYLKPNSNNIQINFSKEK